jgi:HEAT repeat protein
MEVRHRALSTLKRWQSGDVTVRLRGLSASDSVTVAGAAVSALAQDPNEPIELATLHAYLNQQLDALRRPLGTSDIVVYLIRILAERGDSTSVPVLETVAESDNRYIRESAMKALSELRERIAIK